MKKSIISLVATTLLSFLPLHGSLADTAKVMPKGLHRVELQNKFWFPIKQGYTADGDKKDIGAAFAVPLDSNGIAALAAVEIAAGMPLGSASLGHTDIDMTFNYNDLILYYQYGVTDKLTIGAEIPYYWQWTDVKRATVNTDSATVGLNLSGQGPLFPLRRAALPMVIWSWSFFKDNLSS